MDKKTILAVVLSVAVFGIYTVFFAPAPPSKQVAPAQESKQVSTDAATKPTATPATAPKLTARKQRELLNRPCVQSLRGVVSGCL